MSPIISGFIIVFVSAAITVVLGVYAITTYGSSSLAEQKQDVSSVIYQGNLTSVKTFLDDWCVKKYDSDDYQPGTLTVGSRDGDLQIRCGSLNSSIATYETIEVLPK